MLVSKNSFKTQMSRLLAQVLRLSITQPNIILLSSSADATPAGVSLPTLSLPFAQAPCSV